MTKKDYEKAAKIVREAETKTQKQYYFGAFMRLFCDDDNMFDIARFHHACFPELPKKGKR